MELNIWQMANNEEATTIATTNYKTKQWQSKTNENGSFANAKQTKVQVTVSRHRRRLGHI